MEFFQTTEAKHWLPKKNNFEKDRPNFTEDLKWHIVQVGNKYFLLR